MRDHTPSRTAQWVAAARAMGMLLPDDVRLADDPYGLAFTSRKLARLVGDRRPRRLTHLPVVKQFVAYMQVRTRVIDDAVRSFVAGGGRQLVVLGAGFDCRALRLPELAGAAVFEVDHPATQAHKQRTLARLGATSPARYVAWDFETRALDELPGALAAAGHDRTLPTLTLWEGVTMYLTEAAIEASLGAIADWSAPGSQIAMTYMDRARLTRPTPLNRVVQAVVARVGEPFKWGWLPDELPGYLRSRGWSVFRNVSIRDAADEMDRPQLARSIGSRHGRVAFAFTSERVAVSRRPA